MAWLPKSLKYAPKSDSLYFMSCTHRGDMYHVRAIIALQPKSLCLYDYTEANKASSQDLVDYLSIVVQAVKMDVFLVPLDRNTIKDPKLDLTKLKPELLASFQLNGKLLAVDDLLGKLKDSPNQLVFTKKAGLLGEGQATQRLVSTGFTDAARGQIRDSMAMIPSGMVATLNQEIDKVLALLFKAKSPTVLVMHRDSGQAGGPYPELDSGDALPDMVATINEIPATKDGRKLRAVLSGNPKDSFPTIATIGPYWEKLKGIAGAPKEMKRDIEAYFFKRGADQGWFQMGVGFRSGGLDLLTFLGIPSVSIGLRNMVGEDRHLFLAKAVLGRTNVIYDQPRHPLTAWMQGRDNLNYFFSPFWADPTALTPKDIKTTPRTKPADAAAALALQKQFAPGWFASFDAVVFEAGMKIAVEKYIHWDRTIERLVDEGSVVGTSEARHCYPVGLGPEQIQAHLLKLQNLEFKNDLTNRQKKAAELQESDAAFGVYKEAFDRDWAVLALLMDSSIE